MSSGTPTPNLGLNTWTSLDDLDYDEVNANFTSLDQNLPMFACTSTTRPTTNLYNGRLIKETDTNRIMSYDLPNNKWVNVSTVRHAAWDHKWSVQGGALLSVGSATVDAMYWLQGDFCRFNFAMTRAADTNAGTAGVAWA